MRFLLASLLITSAAVAADTPAPAKPADAACPACPACAECPIADIALTELKELVAAKKVVLIDVNGSESFKAGHIPGAIDFAASHADLAKLLPADKSALIVAYCGGPQCPAWKKGASAAMALGYTNIKHLKDGISGWKEAKAPLETVN